MLIIEAFHHLKKHTYENRWSVNQLPLPSTRGLFFLQYIPVAIPRRTLCSKIYIMSLFSPFSYKHCLTESSGLLLPLVHTHTSRQTSQSEAEVRMAHYQPPGSQYPAINHLLSLHPGQPHGTRTFGRLITVNREARGCLDDQLIVCLPLE